jgi:hypothetical protein
MLMMVVGGNNSSAEICCACPVPDVPALPPLLPLFIAWPAYDGETMIKPEDPTRARCAQ